MHVPQHQLFLKLCQYVVACKKDISYVGWASNTKKHKDASHFNVKV